MNIEIIEYQSIKIALLTDSESVINNLDDALDLLGNASYQGAEKILVYEYQLHPSFFDLSTRFAGEVLQKFSTYQMKLALVGDFEKYPSQSLRDFIFESNKYGRISFVANKEEGLARLVKG